MYYVTTTRLDSLFSQGHPLRNNRYTTILSYPAPVKNGQVSGVIRVVITPVAGLIKNATQLKTPKIARNWSVECTNIMLQHGMRPSVERRVTGYHPSAIADISEFVLES
jgi:hypothetical protein